MKKYFLIALGTIVLGWIAFASLIGIDTADVVEYNQLDRHVGTATFRAGDIVSISPDGQTIDSICSLSVSDDSLRNAPLQKSYGNWLEESLPSFARFVVWVRATVTGQKGSAEQIQSVANRIDISGRVVELPAANRPPLPKACVCAVAEKLVTRHSVCMVSKSLNEFGTNTGLDGVTRVQERTIGATLRNNPILIGDVQALGCENISPAASIPKHEPLCSASNTIDTVWLRDKLRVIREYDLQTASFAPDG